MKRILAVVLLSFIVVGGLAVAAGTLVRIHPPLAIFGLALATFRRKNSFSALRRRGRSVTGSFAAMTSGEKKRPPWGTFLLGR